MLKSCKWCGRVHPEGFLCPAKPRRDKKETNAKKFRSSIRWQRIRESALERDEYCCVVCRSEGKDTRLNYNDIEVHHVIPISEDESLADDINNIITLCRYHHELAEKGKIPKAILANLIRKKASPPGF